jgi:hypothetical protein
MDGVSKEIENLAEELSVTAENITAAIKEQIDIEVKAFLDNLTRTAPVKTGGLVRSLQSTQITARKNYYGYEITFDGADKDGTPYQKIANILNYGTSRIQGTRFVSKAVRKLKGMDDRIAARAEKMK